MHLFIEVVDRCLSGAFVRTSVVYILLCVGVFREVGGTSELLCAAVGLNRTQQEGVK